jgi:hypothetical protein
MTDTDPGDSRHALTLHLLPQTLAVCYLPAESAIPAWSQSGSLHAITRTPHELSIVCDLGSVPPDVRHEAPWRCLEVAGPLDFALTGILASLAAPLAESGIPLFALSTYRTDYLLIPAERIPAAINALQQAGHEVEQ